MVQATHFGERHDGPFGRRVDTSRRGRVFLKREMGSRPMIVGKVSSQHATQMPLAQNDDVVQTSRRRDPISRSANGFCQGLDGAAITSVMPMPAMWRRNSSA
jgi:hypothetical protein